MTKHWERESSVWVLFLFWVNCSDTLLNLVGIQCLAQRPDEAHSFQYLPNFRNPTMNFSFVSHPPIIVLVISLSYMLMLHLYLLGKAGRGGTHHGPVGDSSIKHRLDWTNEAGLSRTDRAQEENLSLSHLLTTRSVGADGLHQARLLPRLKFKILQNNNNDK